MSQFYSKNLYKFKGNLIFLKKCILHIIKIIRRSFYRKIISKFCFVESRNIRNHKNEKISNHFLL